MSSDQDSKKAEECAARKCNAGRPVLGKKQKIVKEDACFHRLDSYNAVSVQHSVAVENLIRNNFGAVNRTIFSLKHMVGDIEESVERLLSSLSEFENPQRIQNELHTHFFFAEKWTCRLDIDVQWGEAIPRVNYEQTATGRARTSRGESQVQRKKTVIKGIGIEVNHIVGSSTVETIQGFASDAGFVILHGFEVESGVPVTFAFPGPMGITYRNQSFEDLPLTSVEGNYAEDVLDDVRTVLKRADEVTSGLVLINGPVGTGKSYLIRAILTELRQRQAVICSPPTLFLSEAGMLSQVGANFQKSLIILEDIGEVVACDAMGRGMMDARANLLNFAEGFLSLLMDAIVIISFNYELEKIDPAILRPGRCLANIKVGELSYEHARKLVSFDIPKQKYSLAEVYEMRRVGNANTVVTRADSIGFRT